MSRAEQTSKRDTPTTGVRKSSQHSRCLHRQCPDSDEPMPACGESGRDADWREAHIPSLLPFARFSLCTHDECFPEKGGMD
ncbi:hypothetical protein [Natronomonas pharaonis]|uniref:hypothetical protein n=1 Tax=Natronomonas pharaonis TaxID=2257 RepID=UPI0011D0B29C|nr:hypothetical protein [Natronomonas pharaonis]